MSEPTSPTPPTPTSAPEWCQICGATPAAPYFAAGGHVEPLCPTCKASVFRSEECAGDLHDELWPALVRWAGRWVSRGESLQGISDTLEMYGMYWHPLGASARPDATSAPTSQAAAALVLEAHQMMTAPDPTDQPAAPDLQATSAPTDTAPDLQATDPAAALLTPYQRRNMAARRIEIAAEVARIAAELRQMEELEKADTHARARVALI